MQRALISKAANAECMVVHNVVRLYAIKELLGGEKFQIYASKIFQALKGKEGVNFVNCLVDGLTIRREDPPTPNSSVYITNVHRYSQFKPNGNGRGDNVFYLGNGQYIGFGQEYSSGPISLQTIEDKLRALFISAEDIELDHEAHTKVSALFMADKAVFKRTREKDQNNYTEFEEIDYKKYSKLSFH